MPHRENPCLPAQDKEKDFWRLRQFAAPILGVPHHFECPSKTVRSNVRIIKFPGQKNLFLDFFTMAMFILFSAPAGARLVSPDFLAN